MKVMIANKCIIKSIFKFWIKREITKEKLDDIYRKPRYFMSHEKCQFTTLTNRY